MDHIQLLRFDCTRTFCALTFSQVRPRSPHGGPRAADRAVWWRHEAALEWGRPGAALDSPESLRRRRQSVDCGVMSRATPATAATAKLSPLAPIFEPVAAGGCLALLSLKLSSCCGIKTNWPGSGRASLCHVSHFECLWPFLLQCVTEAESLCWEHPH